MMIAQKDLGASLLFFALFMPLLWVATERHLTLAVGVLLFAGGGGVRLQTFSHVQERVDIWLDPWQDYSGSGFQVAQRGSPSPVAGMRTGLCLGILLNIPVVTTDFVFAAIGEEMGMSGAAAVIIGFMLLVGSGCASPSSSLPFEKLLAAGLTDPARRAGVHHHGESRPPPLTGVDPALRLLRWIVAGRQLRAPGLAEDLRRPAG